jgi:cell division protein FtsW (lipid II flippase)
MSDVHPVSPAPPAAFALPRILGPIRPRPRWREARLLAIVAVTILVGSVSLALAQRAPDAPPGGLEPAEPFHLAVYLGVLLIAHLAQVLAGRRTDQVLLPAVGLLGGISLLLMERLPQNLVVQTIGSTDLGLADVQLIWLVLSISIAATLAIVVRSDRWLRLYKYTWAAVGVALLLLTFVLGTEINGQRLTLSFGPVSGQPSELLKVILVVFLAGYLSENRSLLVEQSTRIGPISLPPVPYLAPMVAMWAIALGIVVVQRDLGAALLFFAVFLLLLYTATGRPGYVVLGLILFVLGAFLMYQIVDHVRTRVDIWLDPFVDPSGAGYQVIQSLYAFARGGLLGTGLGGGLPLISGRLPIPAIQTDFPLAALGEELGLVGIMAILGIYLVVIERGLRIGAAARDDFRALLASGLALVVGVQAFIIAAGNLKLIPLTGITLPFISYGGSSLVANAVAVGLLLALSDRGVEPPPLRPRRRRLARLLGRGAA